MLSCYAKSCLRFLRYPPPWPNAPPLYLFLSPNISSYFILFVSPDECTFTWCIIILLSCTQQKKICRLMHILNNDVFNGRCPFMELNGWQNIHILCQGFRQRMCLMSSINGWSALLSWRLFVHFHSLWDAVGSPTKVQSPWQTPSSIVVAVVYLLIDLTWLHRRWVWGWAHVLRIRCGAKLHNVFGISSK